MVWERDKTFNDHVAIGENFGWVYKVEASRMAVRQFEHLVLFTVSVSEGSEDTGEGRIVQIAWEVFNTAKNQVGFNWR